MGKKLLFVTAFLCALLTLSSFAADTVYLDGTGATDGAYTNLKSAVSALPNGGTVIVCGDTAVGTSGSGVDLAGVNGKVTVTSENGAVLTISRYLALDSELEFNNITINSTHTSNGRIFAYGNKLTIGENVVTIPASNGRYPTIIGGTAGEACNGSHVVIKSGTWFAVFGGSFSGKFTGDSTVDFTGGTIKAVLTGGNRTGNFTGDATLNIGGDAVIEYNKYDEISDYMGVVGGTMGFLNGSACTFNGDITINISGNAQSAANILGANCYPNVTTNGDITITVGGNAKITRNIYAGGYYGGITTGENGIRVILKDNATVGTNRYVCAGALEGSTITGNGYVEFNDNAKLTGAVYAGGYSGSFDGNTEVVINGGTVTSTVSAQSRSGSVSGEQTVTLRGGNVGPVKGDATVDLAAEKSVTVSSCDGTLTTKAPEGYEVVLEGTTYTAKKIITEPAEPKTVYVDGTGKTEDAYTSFAEALANMPGGGTIVVCGDVYIDSAVTLATGGELLITSVYDGEDYTDTAAIKVANDIELGCAVTFKDVVLEKAATGDDHIFANGNKLVIDEGVYCRNILATRYITIVGGAEDGTFEGDSNVTVKSGYFRNIFGGNYNGTFKGTSTVNFLGGYVDNMVIGGTFMGNFEGTSNVNIGGDAVVVYSSSGSGVQGGNCGSGNTQYTFKGDIHLNIFDSARVNQNVYGTSRYSNVTTTGDVYVTVKDDAFLYQNLYAGGYAGTLNGNTNVVVDGGWVGVTLSAGNRGGTVNGNTYLEVNGGQINYYATNIHSSVSDAAGEYHVGGGGLSGKVTGNTVVKINGGDIYGSVYGGSVENGTVGGSSTVTVTGGSIMCGIYADGATSGSVAGTKTLNVDLSKGGTLAVGLSMNVNNLTGGGKLILFPEAVVNADTFSGNVELEINGIPQARNYITATNADDATVSYTAQGKEKFVSNGGTFGISSEGYYATTKVTFKHLKGVEIYPRKGVVTSGDRIKADETYETSTVFYFTPGLYNCVVYHTQDDYKRIYVYVTGEEAEIELDYTNYTPAKMEGFEALHFYENTKVIYDKFYNTDDLADYVTPDTPYFINNRTGTRLFTSNEEMSAFINVKVVSCDWAYAYDLFTSPNGNTVPAVVFTKDEIPADATLEDVAKIVAEVKGRDIMLVTAQVHGNEPSAGEGALAMISEMCGEYGDGLLTGNVGAVIIIPRLNPDGSEAFARETPNGVTVDSGKNINNLNRDYAMASSAEISGVTYAFDLFAPTVFVDCHEAGLTPKWGASETLTDIYDVGLMCDGILNSPFVDGKAIIQGEYEQRDMKSVEIITEVLGDIENAGLRPYYYQTPSTVAAINSSYGLAGGAYTFLIEVPGLSGGDSVFARRVFAHVTALKAIFNYAKGTDGEMAREVAEARENTALSAQKFDIDTPVVLQHSYTRHDSTTFTWNNPLVGSDGTVRKAENITKYYIQDVAMKYRARPTAYVLAKGTNGLDKVLATLDRQGIDYYELKAGTTLELKKYSGDASTATLGSAADVTFENGAYIVPVDGYKANLVATLFEPESYDSGEEINTFVQAGYVTASDIYRSEESYIAAKLGLDGTYIEIATNGKSVENAVVDGVTYEDIDTDGDKCYIARAEDSITLNFTDGTSETYYYSNILGDVDGDRIVTVFDALSIMRAAVNGEFVNNGDMDGDGKVTLIDAIRVMKILVK